MTETRRDVSWTVVFRLDGTNVWTEWSTGHRAHEDAVRNAEVLARVPAVAEIRFDRVTVQRDRHTLHDLARMTDA
ncbi:hypothetical protein OG292_27110 [Streptomyces sp. NBC_01511]|uniref:hypothetical protein n=1 Tax=Streptomyces sp. NBC_01511 TaxID=2903889 RepID=UPI003864A2C2